MILTLTFLLVALLQPARPTVVTHFQPEQPTVVKQLQAPELNDIPLGPEHLTIIKVWE